MHFASGLWRALPNMDFKWCTVKKGGNSKYCTNEIQVLALTSYLHITCQTHLCQLDANLKKKRSITALYLLSTWKFFTERPDSWREIRRCSLNLSLPVNLSSAGAAVVPDSSDAFFFSDSVLLPRVLFTDPSTASGWFFNAQEKTKTNKINNPPL